MHYDFNLNCFLSDSNDFTNMIAKNVLLLVVICILVLALYFGFYKVIDYYEHPTVNITGNNDNEVVYYNGRPISVHHDINDY